MNKFLLIFFAVIFGVSCSNRVSNNVLPPEQMKKILWQMSVAAGVYQSDTSLQTRTHLKDSITTAYRHILKYNKIDTATYQVSLKYYESQPKLMKELLDSTMAYGTKIKDSFALHYHPVYHPAPQPLPPANKNLPKPLLPRVFKRPQPNKPKPQ